MPLAVVKKGRQPAFMDQYPPHLEDLRRCSAASLAAIAIPTALPTP